MRYHWKKYWEAFLFVCLIFLAAFIFIFFDFDKERFKNLYLGIIASLITLYLGLLKIKIEREKFEQTLFTDFNNRYSPDINGLFVKIRKKENKCKKVKLTKHNKQLIIEYLNLCSEEYYWFKRGRIPTKIWDAWDAGIKQNTNLISVEKIIKSEMKNDLTKKSYYKFLEEYVPKK